MKLAALTVMLALGATGAQAQALMSDAELAATRAGLMTPWGQEIGFGAVVRTYIDGELALESQLTWTSAGPETSYLTGAPTPDLATAAARLGLTLTPGAEGLLAPGDGGATVVLHRLVDGHLSGVVLNSASNRQIRQATEVTLALPGLEAAQRGMAAQALTARLHDALGRALSEGALR